MSAVIVFCGHRLPALAHVSEVGEALGLPSRSTAYRLSRTWPRTGQYIVVEALAKQMGLEVRYVDEDDASRPAARMAAQCELCSEQACPTCESAPKVRPGQPFMEDDEAVRLAKGGKGKRLEAAGMTPDPPSAPSVPRARNSDGTFMEDDEAAHASGGPR